MKTLAILGAGGHAKVVADAALCSGWDEVVFFDNRWPALSHVGAWKVIGDTHSFFAGVSGFDEAIIAIGNNFTRLELITRVLEEKIPLATIIHPAATVSRYAVLGKGSVVFAAAVLNPDCQIGVGAIINTSATVDHDCILGEAVHVSPGANLAGGVCVGDLSWIGIGSSVRQQVTIGARVTIGAGAVVVKNIPDDCTAVGVPAEIIQKQDEVTC